MLSTTYCYTPHVGFQARNKEYGAYLLRQNYQKHFFMSFCASLLLAIMVLACPVYVEILVGKTKIVTKTKKINAENNTAYHSTDFSFLPPPPKPKPVEVTPTPKNIKFLPPTNCYDYAPPIDDKPTPTAYSFPQPEPTEKETEEMPQQVPQATKINHDHIICLLYPKPQFKGGQEALAKYLRKNVRYPRPKIYGVEGKVFVRFFITKEGKITNTSIIRGLKDCPECDAEALRLVSNMPDWDVKDVDEKVYPFPISYSIPINFKEKDLYKKLHNKKY